MIHSIDTGLSSTSRTPNDMVDQVYHHFPHLNCHALLGKSTIWSCCKGSFSQKHYPNRYEHVLQKSRSIGSKTWNPNRLSVEKTPSCLILVPWIRCVKHARGLSAFAAYGAYGSPVRAPCGDDGIGLYPLVSSNMAMENPLQMDVINCLKRKITYKWSIFHCHGWSRDGRFLMFRWTLFKNSAGWWLLGGSYFFPYILGTTIIR